MNNNSGGNRFFDGFLWGAIIGGGLVFLLGTKKGKKFLKSLSESGVENLADLLGEYGEDEGEFAEEAPQVSKPTNGNGVVKNNSQQEAKEKKPQRRFFRKKTS